MILLALETATDVPTLALGGGGGGGGGAASRVLAHRRELSRTIDAEVAALLAVGGRRIADLDGVVIADGPGSFTGLRIGAAFAKGLCRAAGLPLYVAPSMLGAARARGQRGGTILVEYDALRGDVYRAAYRFAPDATAVDTLLAPGLARPGEPPAVEPSSILARAGPADAGAEQLLRLVGVPGGAHAVADPATFEPAYGRPAEAEARRLARREPA